MARDMIPGRINGANRKFIGTDDRMGDLPARRWQYADGRVALTSVWFPTTEEIEAITAGRPIYLTILTRTQPPVKLSTKDDWETGR